MEYVATNASINMLVNGYVADCKVMLCGDEEGPFGCDDSPNRKESSVLGKDATKEDLELHGVTPSFTTTRSELPARMDDLRTMNDNLGLYAYVDGCKDIFTGLNLPALKWKSMAFRFEGNDETTMMGGTFKGALHPFAHMSASFFEISCVFGGENCEDYTMPDTAMARVRTALGLEKYIAITGDDDCAGMSEGFCAAKYFQRDFVKEVMNGQISGMANLAKISQYNAVSTSAINLLIGAGVTDTLLSYNDKSQIMLQCFAQVSGMVGNGAVTPFGFADAKSLTDGLICVIDETITALTGEGDRKLLQAPDLDRDAMVATADAAATAVATVNNAIATQIAAQELAVANGEEISTDFLVEVAKTATVALTELAEQIQKVASGEISASDLTEAFSEEAFAAKVAAVEVPAAAAVEAIAAAAKAEEEELANPGGTPPPTTPTTPTTPTNPPATTPPATPPATAEEDEGGSSLGPAIGGAVGGLIVVIAVAYFIMKKKKPDAVDPDGEGVVESVLS